MLKAELIGRVTGTPVSKMSKLGQEYKTMTVEDEKPGGKSVAVRVYIFDKKITNLEGIREGCIVYVRGNLRCIISTLSNGFADAVTEINADDIKLIGVAPVAGKSPAIAQNPTISAPAKGQYQKPAENANTATKQAVPERGRVQTAGAVAGAIIGQIKAGVPAPGSTAPAAPADEIPFGPGHPDYDAMPDFLKDIPEPAKQPDNDLPSA